MTRPHPVTGFKRRIHALLFSDMWALDLLYGKAGYGLELAKFKEKRAHAEAGMR